MLYGSICYWKNLCISGPVQVKPVLSKGPTSEWTSEWAREWTHVSYLIPLGSIWSPLLESAWSFDIGICVISIIQASKDERKLTWHEHSQSGCFASAFQLPLFSRRGLRLFAWCSCHPLVCTVFALNSQGDSAEAMASHSSPPLDLQGSPESKIFSTFPWLGDGLTIQRSGVDSL